MENARRRLKAITRKTAPSTFSERITKLKELQRRLDQLLPYGKYASQTQRARRLAAQQTEVLHLGRLEETGS